MEKPETQEQKSQNGTWPKVIVGIPMERTINHHAFYAFCGLFQHGYPFFRLPYSMRNDRARNLFGEKLLASPFTHLCMLDSDHKHPHDIVMRLARWVVEDPSRLVVAGLNFRRSEPYDPCAFLRDERGGLYAPIDWPRGLVKMRNENGPGYVGTGSILIAREVFERIPPPWFFFRYDRYGLGEDHWPGVDMTFCDLCHEHGIELYLNTTATSPHHMDAWVDERTFRSYIEAHPHEVSETEEQLQYQEVNTL